MRRREPPANAVRVERRPRPEDEPAGRHIEPDLGLRPLEIDPREAALRETEQAIGLVVQGREPVEPAPQNACIRRLQHQVAERANLVSRSRGREPYRRVRLYPDTAGSGWR